VFLGDINRAVAHPELFLSEAKSHATPYAAPAAASLPAATGGKTHRGDHRLPYRRCAYLYGGRSH
jgi:hypothetical protein